MPLKYKVLAMQFSHLDSCINFLKNSRKIESLQFTDVCDSVKQTFGRDMNINIFRQILSIAPEMYVHTWVNNKMTIGATQDLTVASTLDARLQTVKQRLMEKTVQTFVEFCARNSISDSDQYIRSKCWHHAFDPHSEVEDVKLAPLNMQPVSAHRSETFASFLQKNQIKIDTQTVSTDHDD